MMILKYQNDLRHSLGFAIESNFGSISFRFNFYSDEGRDKRSSLNLLDWGEAVLVLGKRLVICRVDIVMVA